MSAPITFWKLFSEFDGAQLNVSFHRAWVTICKYIMKEDRTPYTWRHNTVSTMSESIRASDLHKKMPDRHQHLIAKLKSLDSWEQVYTDADLVKRVFTSHSNLKSIYEDLLVVKEQENSLYDRFVSYLSAAGLP